MRFLLFGVFYFAEGMACTRQVPGTGGIVLAAVAVGLTAAFVGTLFGVFGGKV